MGDCNGGSRAAEKSGGRLTKAVNIMLENPNDGLNQISEILKHGTIEKAKFTTNGNAVKSQNISINTENGRVDVWFDNGWEPTQVTNPKKPIITGIYASIHNPDVKGLPYYKKVTIVETKTKSIKNAKKNYDTVIEKWQKATNQGKIKF